MIFVTSSIKASGSSTNAWASESGLSVPSALRKGLSAIFGVGKEVAAEATRRRSLSRISFDRDVFCLMSASALVHIWLKVRPVFGSMYHLFQTALCAHWGALRLISAKSRFISYSLRRSSSSCNVVSRWTHRCLTAPSMSIQLAYVTLRGAHHHFVQLYCPASVRQSRS